MAAFLPPGLRKYFFESSRQVAKNLAESAKRSYLEMKRENEDCLFEVVVGTYEEYLVGYKFVITDEVPKLVQSMANHSHKGSVKCVAAHDRYFASGGSDEAIQLYDFKHRRQGGMLMHHTGTVTCMKFTPDGSHLITCGEDGVIGIVAVGSWMLCKVWTRAHKDMAVHWITVHPSGRLALSIGGDKTIKTWNLLKGKHAYTTNIASVMPRPEFIEWSVCGEYFGLVRGSLVDIYVMASGAVQATVKVDGRITCVVFLEGQRFCAGTWEGSVICYEFLTAREIWKISPKTEARIKSVAVEKNWLIAANSQGMITVYSMKTDETPIEKASVATSCRITCLTISRLLSEGEFRTAKKKWKKKKVRNNSKDLIVESQIRAEPTKIDQLAPKPKKLRKHSTVGTPQLSWNVTPIK